jgi:hypothetical protein
MYFCFSSQGPHPSHQLGFHHPYTIWTYTQIMKLLFMQFSPVSCYFHILRSKYLQHPVLRCPQPMFFSEYERPSFTPIQNRQSNRRVYFSSLSQATCHITAVSSTVRQSSMGLSLLPFLPTFCGGDSPTLRRERESCCAVPSRSL